ncbi:MAG: cation:proton antiporter [Chloroflexi bacterium]|nr:cation:proton antiporter [Chloroflexota bacterium]
MTAAPALATAATDLLIQLAIVFAAAKIAGEIVTRLGGVALVGELAVGAALGPHALGVIRDDPVLAVLAELGVVVLLFMVGLEMDFGQLRVVGARGAMVGAVGIVLPFVAGAGLMYLTGEPTPTALFVGTALVATSVGITARVLSELGLLGETESVIILAAAVVDDVLGLLVLAAVTAVGSGKVEPLSLAILLVETAVFIGVLLTMGRVAVRRHGHRVRHLRIAHGRLSFALLVCLVLAALAGVIGLAAIVGAFLAGLLVAELSTEERDLKHELEPIYTLLVPFFFVLTGARLDIAALLDPAALLLGVILTVLAVLTKLIGCGLAMWGTSLRSAVRVGTGMVPRGEVGLVVASLGLAAGVIDGALYGAALLMVAVTTLVAPFLLGPAFRFRALRAGG